MQNLRFSSIYASSIHPAPSIAWTATSTTTAKPMNRISASLLYLTVYNPTLKPAGPIPDDDEDAEEQAQILFYTARDRAVSRDRMLRQVGLAKALVNFTEMFNPGGEPCENVHSQTRRMVMISPEPGFWIHCCVELPKTPRRPVKSPSKGKKSEPVKQEPLFDYHEGLVHDNALKAHLQRAYELFKIRHGSFTSILDTLGQQALELQLERFFTVWAWSWDTEEQPDFCLHLGGPLHPCYKTLASQFEPLDDVLPARSIPFAISPSGLIPSPRFSEFNPSPALVQHLRSILPEYVPSVPQPSPDPEFDPNSVKASASNENISSQLLTGGFALPTIPMPAVNLNMDVRNLKWSWPGYLTFGKNSKDKGKQKNPKATADEREPDTELESKPDTGGEGGPSSDGSVADDDVPNSDSPKEEEKVGVEVEVDAVSLADAMGSENSYGRSSSELSLGAGTPSEVPPSPATKTIGPISEDDATPATVQPAEPVPAFRGANEMSEHSISTSPPPLSPEELPPVISEPLQPVTFSQTTVNLAPPGHPLRTTKRRLYYLIKEDITVVIADDENSSLQLQEDLQSVAEAALEVAENLRATIYDEKRRSVDGTPVTAAKILQPKDTHVFSVEGDYTVTGAGGFKSTSEHLYNGQQLLEGDQEISEVFSRDSNPQHWHVARRGNVLDSDGRAMQNMIYYHSAKKESSLADVDNEVAAVVRKFVKSHAKPVSRANTIIAPRPEAHT